MYGATVCITLMYTRSLEVYVYICVTRYDNDAKIVLFFFFVFASMLKYITVRISIDALRCDVYLPYCLAQENNRNHIMDVFLYYYCRIFAKDSNEWEGEETYDFQLKIIIIIITLHS